MENTETLVWLEIALASKYLTKEQDNTQLDINTQVGKLLGHVIKNVDSY